MAGFLYYLSGVQAAEVNARMLAKVGLGHAFDVGASTARGVTGGPDAGNGCIIADAVRVERFNDIGYYPDRQTWCLLPGSDTLWAGYYTDDRPGPDDLRRDSLIPGHVVTLLDGAGWTIPLARGMTATADQASLEWHNALPHSSVYDGTRWQVGQVLPRYARLWDLAVKWWDAFMVAMQSRDAAVAVPDAEIVFNFDGTHEAAVEVLATNYRVGPGELSILGLLSFDLTSEVLAALVDVPTINAWAEKKEAAVGSPISGGPAA